MSLFKSTRNGSRPFADDFGEIENIDTTKLPKKMQWVQKCGGFEKCAGFIPLEKRYEKAYSCTYCTKKIDVCGNGEQALI